MDRKCEPCTDFWRYVNGGWIDRNPIPAHLPRWGSFSVVREANQERIRALLEAAASDKSASIGSSKRKIGDLYTSCMDTTAVDSRALSPIQPDFDRISAIKTVDDLGMVLTHLQSTPFVFRGRNAAVAGAFQLASGQDRKDPSRIIARLVERSSPGSPGSAILSLPDRDYYLKQDTKSVATREEFLKHVSRLLTLSGTAGDVAHANAKSILEFETALAQAALTIAERRDPDKTYHVMSLKELSELAPRFNWTRMYKQFGIPDSTPADVTEPALIRKFNDQLTAMPLDTWKTWLRWRVLQIWASYLPRHIAEEQFRFEKEILSGIKQAPPRWQTCSDVVDQNLGEALGQVYVEKHFPPESKQRMMALVENVRKAMAQSLTRSEWMLPETKERALHKLLSVKVLIGYPDRWHDYSEVRIDRSTLLENLRSSSAHRQRYNLAKIGKPVRRDEFNMTPPTVNAYSSSAEVKIVFPAGILEPPFFDPRADDAINYGAIGAVIGHELGHQFDDAGSKYDASGTVKNWWSADDRKRFEERSTCVSEQFSAFEVGPGLRHNGRQVLGEALGDLGGLTVALGAYRQSLGEGPAPVLDGFTGEQRLFISFARIWGTYYRPEALRLQLNTDNHPIPQYRANGTLQNMEEFHRAFQCKAGDAMVRPPERLCKLW
jgi:predicted metalloendopeptidase